MKNIKISFLVLLLICSSTFLTTANAGAPGKKIIWTFYSEAYDMTIYYNPGGDFIGNVEWPSHDFHGWDMDYGTATYYENDDVLYVVNMQALDDTGWHSITGAFERVD